MKLLTAAALLCLTSPAIAWDADPASFRANPEAWVRNTLMPGCKTSTDKKDIALCDCIAPLVAVKITEADVARVNDPEFRTLIFPKMLPVGFLCQSLVAK